MLNWLNLTALLVFIALIWATIWFRLKAKAQTPKPSRMPGIFLAVLGMCAWALTFQWYLDSSTRVIGFPFTAAIFKLHDGLWADFVGVITIPAMVANLVFWVLLLRLPLTWYRYSRNRD